MGFDLNAFLGPTSVLRKWTTEFPSAVVCPLSGDLAMVPVTAKLFQKLRARLGSDVADRLDAAQCYPTSPSPSHEEGARRWGAEASHGTFIAYVSLGEYGDFGYENASLWADGKLVLSDVGLQTVLDYFGAEAGLVLGGQPIDLERYRGEDAAEKWAAASLLQNPGKSPPENKP
jgi:hypothetical protein